MARYLYLARHGEARPDQSGLTANGRRQAELLGQRLQNVQFSAVHHSPLPRAVETAQLLGLNVPLQSSDLAGDYIPYLPSAAELPADSADDLLNFLAQFTPDEIATGAELGRQAIERFTGPTDEDQRELVITHNFQIAWLVRQALDAPPWRWLTLNHCNAALTVLRYTRNRPATIAFFNDMTHLPANLQWTGFPPDLRV
jgi:probable phosphoglycerate mutase